MDNRIISTVILTIGLVVISLLGFQRVDRYLRNRAVDECLKASSKNYSNQVESGVYMDEEQYNACLKKKGYQ